jgi:hypothetical protein
LRRIFVTAFSDYVFPGTESQLAAELRIRIIAADPDPDLPLMAAFLGTTDSSENAASLDTTDSSENAAFLDTTDSSENALAYTACVREHVGRTLACGAKPKRSKNKGACPCPRLVAPGRKTCSYHRE